MADVSLVADLLNRRSQRRRGQNQVQVEALARYWEGDEIQLARDTQLFIGDDGNLIGFACVLDPRAPFVEITYQVATNPDASSDSHLWDEMIRWCSRKDELVLGKAPEGVSVYAKAAAPIEDEDRWSAYERAGFRRVRVEHRMQADLGGSIPKPAWPDGIVVPPFDLEELPALVALDQQVFRDHWGQVERPFEEELRGWKEWIHSQGEDLDLSLWFVARAGDDLIGYAICEPQIAGDTSRAYLAGFGVRADYRRQGIGLALLHQVSRTLQDRRFQTVELDMDSENLTGASQVYERAGYVTIRQNLLYEKLLRDGTDITVRSLD